MFYSISLTFLLPTFFGLFSSSLSRKKVLRGLFAGKPQTAKRIRESSGKEGSRYLVIYNCRMESFFATLKKEKIYRIAAYKRTREEVRTIIFRYVYMYYNRVRVYSRNPLGLPPAKYREWIAEWLKTNVA